MLRGTEALRAILQQPLDYLHPHRGVVPALFGEPAARALLNQSLLRGLALSCPDPQQLKRNPWTDCWVAHWQHLPAVARLMGAHLMWPQLARGARMRELDVPTRAFARINLGNRPAVVISEAQGLEPSLDAWGSLLGSLASIHPGCAHAASVLAVLAASGRVAANLADPGAEFVTFHPGGTTCSNPSERLLTFLRRMPCC